MGLEKRARHPLAMMLVYRSLTRRLQPGLENSTFNRNVESHTPYARRRPHSNRNACQTSLPSQLRVDVDGSPESLEFYSRHGFVRSSAEDVKSPTGGVILAGEREAALKAVKASLEDGAVPGAGAMNLMARLLHDAGDLQGAVEAYIKALEVPVWPASGLAPLCSDRKCHVQRTCVSWTRVVLIAFCSRHDVCADFHLE